MVEKTQRAISILQQRQSEAANVRSAEELVADIQAKASLAILEVKQSAVEEIKQLQQGPETAGGQSKSKDEVRQRSSKGDDNFNKGAGHWTVD